MSGGSDTVGRLSRVGSVGRGGLWVDRAGEIRVSRAGRASVLTVIAPATHEAVPLADCSEASERETSGSEESACCTSMP